MRSRRLRRAPDSRGSSSGRPAGTTTLRAALTGRARSRPAPRTANHQRTGQRRTLHNSTRGTTRATLVSTSASAVRQGISVPSQATLSTWRTCRCTTVGCSRRPSGRTSARRVRTAAARVWSARRVGRRGAESSGWVGPCRAVQPAGLISVNATASPFPYPSKERVAAEMRPFLSNIFTGCSHCGSTRPSPSVTFHGFITALRSSAELKSASVKGTPVASGGTVSVPATNVRSGR